MLGYPKNRINQLAQKLPAADANGRAFAIDHELSAVIEFKVISTFDVVLNRTSHTWTLAGVHKPVVEYDGSYDE